VSSGFYLLSRVSPDSADYGALDITVKSDKSAAPKERKRIDPGVRGRPTVSSWEFLRSLSQYLRFCADGSPEPSDRDVSSVGSGLYARTGRVWRPVHTGDAEFGVLQPRDSLSRRGLFSAASSRLPKRHACENYAASSGTAALPVRLRLIHPLPGAVKAGIERWTSPVFPGFPDLRLWVFLRIESTGMASYISYY